MVRMSENRIAASRGNRSRGCRVTSAASEGALHRARKLPARRISHTGVYAVGCLKSARISVSFCNACIGSELHQTAGDEFPLVGAHRGDGKPVAARESAHPGTLPVAAQVGEADQPGLADETHVDVEPAGRVALGFAVEVGAFPIELACIGIRRRRDLCDARDAGLWTARVIEKDLVADLHLFEHEIARLVVAHPEPGRGLAWSRGEVVYAELVGLRLHQPIWHGRKYSIQGSSNENAGSACVFVRFFCVFVFVESPAGAARTDS